jgi:hypothetical protein
MQINISAFVTLACAVLAISALPQIDMSGIKSEADHLKWTNGEIQKEKVSLSKERAE